MTATVVRKNEEVYETESELRGRIPSWANAVMCPRCGWAMTPIRAKRDNRWGESITLQCHGTFERKLCLMVSQITTSVRHQMFTEDVGEFDFDWRKVAERKPEVTGEAEQPVQPEVVVPENPFARRHGKSIVWDTFWRLWSENGIVSATDLRDSAMSETENPSTQRTIDSALKDLPKWMGELSNYRFVLQGRNYVFAGVI